MDNNKDYQTYKSEQQESYNDVNGNHINVKRTEETVNNSDSYKDGYVNAQEDLAARDNNNAARGLVIGLLLTTLVGLTAGVIYFLNQRNDTPAPAAPTVIVTQKPEAKPSPEAKQTPEKQTTIIEKTRDVIVPVPQQQATPQPSTTPAPRQNINISIPNPVSKPQAEQKAPSTSQTSKESNQSNITPTQSTKSDTTTSTPTPSTKSDITPTPTPSTKSDTTTSSPVPESSQTDIKSETNSDNSGTSNTSSSPQ